MSGGVSNSVCTSHTTTPGFLNSGCFRITIGDVQFLATPTAKKLARVALVYGCGTPPLWFFNPKVVMATRLSSGRPVARATAAVT